MARIRPPYYFTAYGLALKHGFQGTEQEWLESLNGDKVQLRYLNGILQWKWVTGSDDQWQDLIDLSQVQDWSNQAQQYAQDASDYCQGAEEAAQEVQEATEELYQKAEALTKSVSTRMVVAFENGSIDTGDGADANGADYANRIRSGYFPNLSGKICVAAPTTIKSRLVFYNADLSFHSSAGGFTAGSYQVSKAAAFARLIVGYEDDSEVSDVDALANMVAVYMPVEVPETAQPLDVMIMGSEADGYTASKTLTEILTAHNNQTVRCLYDNHYLPLVYIDGECARFAAVLENGKTVSFVEIDHQSVISVGSNTLGSASIPRIAREYEVGDYILALTYHTTGSDAQSGKGKILMYLSADGVKFSKVAAIPVGTNHNVYDISATYFGGKWVIAYDYVDTSFNGWTQEHSDYHRGSNRIGILTTSDFVSFRQTTLDLPLDWKSTWGPELFVDGDKLYMLLTTSSCQSTFVNTAGLTRYVKDGIYLCELSEAFKPLSITQITLPDDGITPENYIDASLFHGADGYYLAIKEESQIKQRIYKSATPDGNYTLIHEFAEKCEGMAIVNFNGKYFAYADDYFQHGTYISVSRDLTTWSDMAIAEVQGGAWIRHFTPFVVSTAEQRAGISAFLSGLGNVDESLEHPASKSYCLATNGESNVINRLLLEPGATYYVNGSGNVTINAVETALLSHGDECAFVVASIKDTASITFKYTADNQLYWGGAEDFVFNDKNRAISVRCTFGSNGRYCFFASSGYPAVSGYSLPIASADTLGGVQPVAKTDEMTVPVGVDAAGGLWVNASGGTQDGSGSSGGATETMLVDFMLEEDVSQVDIPLDDAAVAALNSAREIFFELGLTMPSADDGTETGTLTFGIAASWGMNLTLMQGAKCLPTNAAAWADGCNAVGVVTLSKIFRICTGTYTFRVNNTTAVSDMVGGAYNNIAGGQTLRAVGSIPIGAGSRIRLYVR